MDQLIGILVFAFGILFSIGLHEIGHLLPAKKFGVRVPTYMIGFGPTLWSKVKGDTTYGIKLIPMGGYIRMIGMYPPNPKGEVKQEDLGRMGNLIEEARQGALAEISDEDANRVFYKLSVPKKLTVMFGGPFMNLVIATVLFFVTLSGIGFSSPTTTLDSVLPCVPTASNQSGIASTDGSCGDSVPGGATSAGIKAGDKIVDVAGMPINTWEDLAAALDGKAGQVVPVVVERNGSQLSFNPTVGSITENGVTRSFLGVMPKLEMETMPASQVPGEMWKMTVASVEGLLSFPKQVFNLGQTLVNEEPRDMNGPVSVIGVGRISGQLTAADAISSLDKISILLMLLASLNLFLFLFNLVPILPLDGGHIAGALYEGLRKSFAKLTGKPNPGPVDTAKMLPVAYIATLFILAMSLVVMLADIIKPLIIF